MPVKSKQKEQAAGATQALPSPCFKPSSFIDIPLTVQEILDEHIARKLA
jgi:hypothetical protein